MAQLKVLDLFCGAGGFSLGFRNEGFSVTGVDINPRSGEIFSLNKIGNFIERNLAEGEIKGDFDIIIGGPPCRPWSSINVKREELTIRIIICWSVFPSYLRNQTAGFPSGKRSPAFRRS